MIMDGMVRGTLVARTLGIAQHVPPSEYPHFPLDTPNYVPGRFHAHARPSPIPSTRIAPNLAVPRPRIAGRVPRTLVADSASVNGQEGERGWLLLRPDRDRVESWLDHWWRRCVRFKILVSRFNSSPLVWVEPLWWSLQSV